MSYKKRIVDYAEWGWGRAVPYFCAAKRHHETELIRLVKGDGEIYINGEKHVLKQGELYIVRPLILHTIRKTGENAPVVDFVKVDLRLLAQNCDSATPIAEYLHFFNDKNAHCVVEGDADGKDNSARIIAALFEEDCSRDKMQRAVYRMLRHLYEHRTVNNSSGMTDERKHFAAQTALEYITSNYSKQIKVSDVASLVGYDEFYTMKLFKKYCGWSIVDYVNGTRVTVAKKQLLKTDADINKIAANVGYKSASYFNRQFKKTFGITPGEFRAKN